MHPNMHRLTPLLLLLSALACATGVTPTRGGTTTAPREEIAAMMARAASAWTRGDLDGFMSDYLDSSRTTYVGRTGLLRGRAAIRAAYAPRFAPGAMRDSLSFEGLEVDEVAPGIANVIAFYVLMRGDSTTARGPTSLLMERVNGRWLIVHDHSS